MLLFIPATLTLVFLLSTLPPSPLSFSLNLLSCCQSDCFKMQNRLVNLSVPPFPGMTLQPFLYDFASVHLPLSFCSTNYFCSQEPVMSVHHPLPRTVLSFFPYSSFKKKLRHYVLQESFLTNPFFQPHPLLQIRCSYRVTICIHSILLSTKLLSFLRQGLFFFFFLI